MSVYIVGVRKDAGGNEVKFLADSKDPKTESPPKEGVLLLGAGIPPSVGSDKVNMGVDAVFFEIREGVQGFRVPINDKNNQFIPVSALDPKKAQIHSP